MKFAQIRKYDVANGPGIRTSVFVTGCTHACPNCFNPEYQSFSFGSDWTEEQTQCVIDYLTLPEVAGLTLLGGEPMQNVQGLSELVTRVKREVGKSVWIYSGYTFEELMGDPEKKAFLFLCDVLVDGRFIEAQKDLNLRFRGSANQRIIDLKKTADSGHVVEWTES